MSIRHVGGRRFPRPEGERGETLLELMATVVLMGTAVIGLISAMFALTSSSQQFRRASDANLTVHAYAEALKGSSAPVGATTTGTYSYVPCAGLTPAMGTYPAYASLKPNFTATIASIEYWDGTQASDGTLNWSNTCTRTVVAGLTPTTYEDKGLQRITIVVASNIPSQRFPVSERLTLVKRDSRCLYTYNNATSGPC